MSSLRKVTFQGWGLPTSVQKELDDKLGDRSELAKKPEPDANCAQDKRDTDRPGPMPTILTCECAWKLSYYGIRVSCDVCRQEE